MKINDIQPQNGSFHRSKRVGRGIGSGHGKNSGRGENGQKSRSGTHLSAHFEGGQMPFVRRIPKRGFYSFTREEFQIINLSQLNRFEAGTKVTKDLLKETGLIKNTSLKLKILAKGELNKGLTVQSDAFSKKAKSLIEEKGGKAEVL
ncbi:MAG: 50S ribosomal protein L15 [Candidatus Atribacteria bacterium]|nr:50S ribosomal protein L15 [Candidatus Atribacteria bacterium]